MGFRQQPRLILAAALGAAMLTSGCVANRDHQGYIIDDTLVTAVQPGVDNRESVLGTLGRPTFVGQFDDRDWYYVSRDTHQLAFSMPTPHAQTVLRVHFDQAGNVERVDRTGMELVSRINPINSETPTLGRHRNLFRDLFGNIGAVGQGAQRGGTTDNPQ